MLFSLMATLLLSTVEINQHLPALLGPVKASWGRGCTFLRVLHHWTDGRTNNADEFHQVRHRHCVKHSCDTNALKPTPLQVRGGNKKAQWLNNTAEGGWCVKSVSFWKIELQPWTRESGISPHYRSSGTQGKMVTPWVTNVFSIHWWILTGHVRFNWPVSTNRSASRRELVQPSRFSHMIRGRCLTVRRADALWWMEVGRSKPWSSSVRRVCMRQDGWLFW